MVVNSSPAGTLGMQYALLGFLRQHPLHTFRKCLGLPNVQLPPF
jgi:hypothetical protein